MHNGSTRPISPVVQRGWKTEVATFPASPVRGCVEKWLEDWLGVFAGGFELCWSGDGVSGGGSVWLSVILCAIPNEVVLSSVGVEKTVTVLPLIFLHLTFPV
ncbi:hypothetical protein AVEN_266357-1 [Araneus ventricosus]|uniref:Uncharacterized protein n=1 Tax=Araneus ventricosus TaxID=182803 RepID=A0A4Y2CPW2_ARAVE|nr:hypothetical protein AVEN_266357-1 [Araneus ventricosus]